MAKDFEISLEGVDRTVKNIASKYSQDRVNGVVKRNTAQLQQKAQANAAVDTGFMKRSIAMETQPSILAGMVTVGADYGPQVEYGNRFQSAQPFMRPARNAQAPIFIKDLRDLAKD